MKKEYKQLAPDYRLLLGPGPVEVSPRVLNAMSKPLYGHLDHKFLDIANETMELLRYAFQTENRMTLPMSGTGSAGMETVMVNLLEPGDSAIVCVSGVFGQRLRDMAGRCGAKVISVEAPWGEIIDPEKVREAFKNNSNIKLVAIVHAETSTGVKQPLEEISRIAKENDALLVVDAVTSLGGTDLKIDEWGIDACYSGTQKALSCPPGLSPVTFGKKAIEALNNRKTKVNSWYLDLSMIQNYWGQERTYHHTAPINMIYGLREALLMVYEEGLEERFKRHQLNSDAFVAGVEAMGLKMVVKNKEHRLPTLNAVSIPEGVEDAAVRKYLLEKYGIEIGGGLGDFKGKAWRVGLMGESSSRNNVILLLGALGDAFMAQGHRADVGAAITAALNVYQKTSR
ncbi:pyridoxal-phosphate-dependent aminotransferase family protein [Lutispora saccharofermentans]|uniref:Alanine--glyoxylate aminotransferase family protein n=1 Tax=Lutispora saccharofermentans TaxID=3024236 RepID=A0ABT1NCT8_9FIRM|nr:alanine--glyoxylate aminotransferase family protein [Lutispora saccharofermentans]MCQ1529078.1 alanine--glyoxylate aminotransferase family protein [Lutispora saccharofermentans]